MTRIPGGPIQQPMERQTFIIMVSNVLLSFKGLNYGERILQQIRSSQLK